MGSNLVHRLVNDGHDVAVFDSTSRPGSARNAAWLASEHANRVHVTTADVRDAAAMRYAVEQADTVYHLAGQVAVTTSTIDPRTDFDVNAGGALNVLEAARAARRPPTVVFASTNKVYGGLHDIPLRETNTRWKFADGRRGIDELQPLDFHSPYGCSKGAADQYMRDYARIYGIPTAVLRFSCIAGPRQFGTEDQGWLMHFVASTLRGMPLTIFGDGKQVRDVLDVDDAIAALRAAAAAAPALPGEIYNIGGGPDNAVSVWAELRERLATLGRAPTVHFAPWRPGDQRIFVTDTRKAASRLGWQPLIPLERTLQRLAHWVATLDAGRTPLSAAPI